GVGGLENSSFPFLLLVQLAGVGSQVENPEFRLVRIFGIEDGRPVALDECEASDDHGGGLCAPAQPVVLTPHVTPSNKDNIVNSLCAHVPAKCRNGPNP